MSAIESLKQAIAACRPVEFRYVREGKDPGIRVGHPHVVHIFRRKDGVEVILTEIFQVGGASASGDPVGWRRFNVDELGDVEVLLDRARFKIEQDFNPRAFSLPIAIVSDCAGA